MIGRGARVPRQVLDLGDIGLQNGVRAEHKFADGDDLPGFPDGRRQGEGLLGWRAWSGRCWTILRRVSQPAGLAIPPSCSEAGAAERPGISGS